MLVKRFALCWRKVAITCLALLGLSLSAPALSQEADVIDLKRAAEIALETYGGQILKAEEVEEEGQQLFHIRLVNEGRVRDVKIEADTGRVVTP
ncbi:PepSY domain-containing protein [Nitrincola alkalilacustris]|uniref:PepSY domain-containing protein n=1 Tax=Nitrincola alkalilacustris TaxID=1571224 RepID=UPI0014568F22|nr:PepSY domain-containing protein [Nitrincola alkalilacustris]